MSTAAFNKHPYRCELYPTRRHTVPCRCINPATLADMESLDEEEMEAAAAIIDALTFGDAVLIHDEYTALPCEFCGGTLDAIGTLGQRLILKCPECGLQTSVGRSRA